MEEDPNLIINEEFFENLWPLILDNNICDIKSEDKSKHFVPERKFDYIWAHTLLAENHFEDYLEPIELTCKPSVSESERLDEAKGTEEIEQKPYRGLDQNVIPLDRQLEAIDCDVQLRKKLAYDFANRTFPWYIQTPTYNNSFTLTDELKAQFKNPFEYEILHNIHIFECNLMIIDLGLDVTLQDLERWEKFSPYVAIVTVVHSADLFRQLKNYCNIFQPVFMEEQAELTWQEELNCALKTGINFARSFTSTIFANYPGFTSAIFANYSEMTSIIFANYPGFISTIFANYLLFNSRIFTNYPGFTSIIFTNYLGFTLTIFANYPGFTSVIFANSADFISTMFVNYAGFIPKIFANCAGFTSTMFANYSSFIPKISANCADFISTMFANYPDFISTIFANYPGFTLTIFTNCPDLSLFS
uniref:Uncharacterized protein n=1 Tax=Glossina brevipalpis TaxID=37001 RepID=A0A1A9WHB5_9MUSC